MGSISSQPHNTVSVKADAYSCRSGSARAGAISHSLWTKGLALLCIVQNVFLIFSVALRLKLYVEAYDLSVLRFHVGSFLALLVFGYALLACKILREKSLNWLVFANGVAAMAVDDARSGGGVTLTSRR